MTVTCTGTLKKIEFTHFITISPQYKTRKRDHINMKGSSVNAV